MSYFKYGKPYLERLGDYIPIAVTLSPPTKDIRIKNKDSALITPCDNQVHWKEN